MKKKLSSILAILTIVAVASLTACSGNSQPTESSEAPQSSSAENSTDNSDNSSSEASANSSSENTSSDYGSVDDTSSDNSSTDDTSSDNSSTDDTSSDNSSADDTSSDNSSTDDTSSDNSSADDTESAARSEKGDAIAKTAYDMLGKPFTDGGYKPETGFDNSGLIYYALTSAGVECPRGLTAQKDMGKEVSLSELQKGDIVFIKDGESFFAGIYTGDNTIVFSPFPGQKVRTADLRSIYYIDNFLKAVRVD
jgi:cell wall-associated NlpC family hydrolase